MKKNITLILILTATLLIPLAHAKNLAYKKIILLVNDCVFEAQIAGTEELRKLGLAGRERLDEDKGLFFMFEHKGYHDFWMKDMKFPIDIIWIRNSTVIDIKTNIPPPLPSTPDSNLVLYRSKGEADSVLEVAAGVSKKCGIKIGDKVLSQ